MEKGRVYFLIASDGALRAFYNVKMLSWYIENLPCDTKLELLIADEVIEEKDGPED